MVVKSAKQILFEAKVKATSSSHKRMEKAFKHICEMLDCGIYTCFSTERGLNQQDYINAFVKYQDEFNKAGWFDIYDYGSSYMSLKTKKSLFRYLFPLRIKH